MKGFLQWLRDHVLGGLLVAGLLAWSASLSMDGLMSSALQSGKSFTEWLNSPIEITRWKLLFSFVAAFTYIALYLVGRVSAAKEKELRAVAERSTEESRRPDSASVDSANLDANQIAVLKFLADIYARRGSFASNREVAEATGLSVLWADQSLDQLSGHKLIQKLDRRNLFKLAPSGREWLLANGYN